MRTYPQEDLSKNVYSMFVYCISQSSLTTQEMAHEIVVVGNSEICRAGWQEKTQRRVSISVVSPKAGWMHNFFSLGTLVFFS